MNRFTPNFCLILVASAVGTGTIASGDYKAMQAQALTLPEAVNAALKNNPLIEAAREDVRAARANVGIARSRKGLQLSANTFITGGNMQSILQSGMSEPKAFTRTETGFFFDQNVMLMLPLYTGGMLEGMIAAAIQEERAASGEAQEVEAEVALRVTQAYYRALYAAQLIEAEQARVTANEEMVRTTRARFESGKDIEASVTRAEAELSMARRQLTTARNEQRKAVLNVQRAMAADLSIPGSVTGTLELGDNPFPSVDAAVEQAKKSRGMLLASEAMVRAAEGELRSARGSSKPQIYGQAMGDVTNQEMMRGGATFGITISFPLIDAGQRRSEISRAHARVAKAKAEQRDKQLDVENEIRQAWLDLETARANAQSARAEVASAEAAYQVMALRVEAGKSILLEQLDALQALNRARAMYAEALYMQQEAIAMVRRAVGEVAR